MPHSEAQNIDSLRAAITWALHLADEQNHSLIGAVLADALHLAEQIPIPDEPQPL